MSCCFSPVIRHLLTLMVLCVGLVLSDSNRCYLLPPDDNCHGPAQINYYYKFSAKKCVSFTYTGCLYLAANRFDTLGECQNVCINGNSKTSTTTPQTPPPTNSPTPLPANICKQPIERGVFAFLTFFTRYWYNHTSRKCQDFYYSGMGGNQNNFMTLQDCIDTCGSTAPPVNTAPSIVSTSTGTISRTTTTPIPDPSVSYEILIDELNYYSSKDIDIPLMTSYQLTYATPSTKSSSTSHSETSSSTTAHASHTDSRSTDTAEPVTTSSVIVNSHSDNSVQLTITVYTSLFIATLLILVCILVGSLIIVMYIKHRRTLLDIHSLKAVNPVSVKFWHSSGSKASNTKYPQTKPPSAPGPDPALYPSTSVPAATGTSSTAASYQFTTSTNDISINNPNTTSTNISTTSTDVSTSTSTSTTSTDGNSTEGNSTEDIHIMS